MVLHVIDILRHMIGINFDSNIETLVNQILYRIIQMKGFGNRKLYILTHEYIVVVSRKQMA